MSVVVATAQEPDKGGGEVIFVGDVGEVFEERDHGVVFREVLAGFWRDVGPAAGWRHSDVSWVDV